MGRTRGGPGRIVLLERPCRRRDRTSGPPRHGEHPGSLRRRQVLPDHARHEVARRRRLLPIVWLRLNRQELTQRHPTRPRRYDCKGCLRRFDDLIGTVFAGHHPPLRAWIARLYLMSLNLSGLQITRESGIAESDARSMIATLRQGIVDRPPPEELSNEVECDEVSFVAGHKGHPEAVEKNRVGRRRRLKGAPGRGTFKKKRPPIFGMLQRSSRVVIRILENVKQAAICPLIASTIVPGTGGPHRDEYDIYARLEEWGYRQRPSTMERGSTPATKTTASVRSTPTPSMASGRCCGVPPRHPPGDAAALPGLLPVRP